MKGINICIQAIYEVKKKHLLHVLSVKKLLDVGKNVRNPQKNHKHRQNALPSFLLDQAYMDLKT